MKNIILISSQVENPIDAEHRYVCVGLNCWGMSETSAKEALKNAGRTLPQVPNTSSPALCTDRFRSPQLTAL